MEVNTLNKDKKTERIIIRMTKPEKKKLFNDAKASGQSVSEYARSLVESNKKYVSHEQYIADSIERNQLINDLLANDRLSNKAKEIISDEVRKYV